MKTSARPAASTVTTADCSRNSARDRVIDTPISEKGIIGLGVGAAATGLRPIVDIMFMDFLGECMDEVANQMAKMRFMFGGSATLPITVLTMAGAGASLAAQHSQSLEAWLVPPARPEGGDAGDAVRREGSASSRPRATTTRCSS